MNPHVNQSYGKKRVEASGETFPADNQAAVLALEPRKRPLGLITGHILFDRPPPRCAALPYPFGNLGPDAASAETMPKVCGVIPLIHCQHLGSFTRSAACASADVQGIQQREDLGPLVTIGRRGARGQRQARALREAMDEDAFAFAAIGDALTAAFSRGKTSRPRRRTATESCHVPQRARGGALASRPASRRPASAAATDAPRSWRP